MFVCIILCLGSYERVAYHGQIMNTPFFLRHQCFSAVLDRFVFKQTFFKQTEITKNAFKAISTDKQLNWSY